MGAFINFEVKSVRLISAISCGEWSEEQPRSGGWRYRISLKSKNCRTNFRGITHPSKSVWAARRA